jgi:hypothetical protein
MAENDPEDPPLRQAKGRFAPGHKQIGHRKKGAGNKYNLDIREALIGAATQIGGGGKHGLHNFFVEIGTTHPRTLGRWVADLVPKNPPKVDEHGDPIDGPFENINFSVNIIGIEHGRHLSKAEIEAAMVEEMPPLLEYEPEPVNAVDDNDDDPPKSAA